jgi:hypothetical protein
MLNPDRQKLWIQNVVSKLNGVLSSLETQLAGFKATIASQALPQPQDFEFNVKSFQMQVSIADVQICDNIAMADEILQKLRNISSAQRSPEDNKLLRDIDDATNHLKGFQSRLDAMRAADALPLFLKKVTEFEDLSTQSIWSKCFALLRRRFIPFFIDGFVSIMQMIYPHIQLLTTEKEAQLPISRSDFGGRGGPQPLQKNLYMHVWGRNLPLLLRVVEDALKWEFDKRPDQKVQVLTWDNEGRRNGYASWQASCTRDARSKSSVFFDGDLMDELIADARHFYNPKTVQEVYHAKGKPHRRGYLLYGAPGCGKTSFISVRHPSHVLIERFFFFDEMQIFFFLMRCRYLPAKSIRMFAWSP